jgi:protein phosphatase PTC7
MNLNDFSKTDNINDADEYMITTLPGDIVVMGSDGLWDNLYPEEVLEIIEQYSSQPAQRLSSIITKIAKIKSAGNMQTPFSTSYNYFDKHQAKYIGGKPDDITVVIAKILNKHS